MVRSNHKLNLTGQMFGRWTVGEGPTEANARGEIFWPCTCSCGTKRLVKAGSLTSGKSKSCGCYHKEQVTLHGQTGTKTFKSWDSMLQRCLNPNAPDYRRYGGRGIRVDPRWVASYDAFVSDMGQRPEGSSLDRVDVNGNYGPENCRWSTRSGQQRNKRNTPMLEWNGATLSWADWADRTGIPSKHIGWRLSKGWTVERTLTTPVAPRTRRGSS